MVGVRVVIISDGQVDDELPILLVILQHLSPCILLCFTRIHDGTYSGAWNTPQINSRGILVARSSYD